MKGMRRLISGWLAICMVLSMLPMQVYAVEGNETEPTVETTETVSGFETEDTDSSSVIASGTCGENVTWVLNAEGTMTISGNGAISYTKYPWNDIDIDSVKKIIIEDGITAIQEEYVFSDWNGLLQVDIADSVTDIGRGSFSDCSKLKNVSIPNGLTSIKDDTFSGCSSLTEIIIPNSVTNIGSCAFSECISLEKINIPDGVELMEPFVFSYCLKLTSINIPDSVITIKSEAFKGCQSLTTVTLSESLTSIGAGAFAVCPNLQKIKLPRSVKSIGEDAFERSGLTEIIIPKGVTRIEDDTFYECKNLSRIIIPSTVRYIGICAFDRCTSLQDFYYTGTDEQLKQIDIEDYGNDILKKANIYTNSEFAFNDDFVDDPSVELEDWQKAYYDFIVQDRNSGSYGKTETYELLYIDNDPIPEIWIYYDQSGNTGRLLSYQDGTVIDFITGRSTFSYVPSNNYFHCYGGSFGTGGCWNKIYVLKDGKISEVASGSYTSIDSSYNNAKYFWNEKPVSEDEYYSYIRQYLDPDITRWTYSEDSNIYNYNSILEYLTKPKEVYRIEITPNESDLSVPVGQELQISCSLYCNDTLVTDWVQPTVSFSSTGTTDNISYIGWEKSSAGNWILKIKGENPGTEYITIYDSGSGATCTVSITIVKKNFNEATYRADLLLDEDRSYTADHFVDYVNNNSPTRIFTKSGDFEEANELWRGVVNNLDALVDAEKLAKYHFDQVDIYSSILLASLGELVETEKIYNNVKSTVSESKKWISILKDLMMTEFNVDISSRESFAKMTVAERTKLKNEFMKMFKEDKIGKIVAGADKTTKALDDIMDKADCVASFVTTFLSYSSLYYVSDSMAAVLDVMYNNAPSGIVGTDEYYLKSALDRCRKQIRATSDDFIDNCLLTAAWTSAGEFAITESIKYFWNSLEKSVVTIYPGVGFILASYKASRSVTSAVFNVDDISENGYKMTVVNKYYDLLNESILQLLEGYYEDQTIENAQAVIDSITLLYQLSYQDCDVAYSYVNAIDSALHTKFMNFLSSFIPVIEYKDYSNAQDYITGTKVYLKQMFDSYDVSWVHYLNDDYPEEYYNYCDLIGEQKPIIVNITRSYDVNCPVNVFVYDTDDNLVAYVEGDYVYASGNITVIRDGDHKTINFYDDNEYRIVCDGYSTGTMDVFVTEYKDDAITRECNFFDLPVAVGETYEMDADKNLSNAVYSMRHNDDVSIPADFDSDFAETSVHLTIDGGFFEYEDGPVLKTEAFAGEAISICAAVPENDRFIRWGTNGDIEIEDAFSLKTTVIVPDKDVAIYAIYENTSSDVNKGGECGEKLSWILEDNGTLVISGTGAMHNYTTKEPAPWYEYRDLITSVGIEDGVSGIGDHAFYECKNICDVTLSDTVTSIGQNAFYGIKKLSSIKIPKNLVSIAWNAFTNCPALEAFNVDTNSEYFMSQDGILYSKNGSVLVRYPEGKKDADTFIVPESVTELSGMAFAITCLKEVKLHDEITIIGEGAFLNSALERIILPKKLEKISVLTFQSTEITSILIPGSVNHIADGVFNHCSKLKNITFEGSAPVFNPKCFQNTKMNAYYPTNDPSWTKSVMQDYGGEITWIPSTDNAVYRVAGGSRFTTCLAVANELKVTLGIEQFDSVVVTDGWGFPDALAGTYLAAVKNAPILLIDDDHIDMMVEYIDQNMKNDGTIYILGDVDAVSSKTANRLAYVGSLKRLGGASRYRTNLKILEELDAKTGELVVVYGITPWDALSVSSSGCPILLVNEKLRDDQKEYLETTSFDRITVIGSNKVISDDLMKELSTYCDNVGRVYGSSRYWTTIEVAEYFYGVDNGSVMLACGNNFPDGLCCGVLARAKNAPVLLTDPGRENLAADYVTKHNIQTGYVIGSAKVVSDASVRTIFKMSETDMIK